MLEQMSSMELSEWMAYYEVEPFGEERADYRSAMIAWVLASVYSKKGHKPKIEDFMPFLDKKRSRQQSPEEIQGVLNLVSGLGSK